MVDELRDEIIALLAEPPMRIEAHSYSALPVLPGDAEKRPHREHVMSTIALALHDLLNEQGIPLEEAIERHFTDDYRQRTNGEISDRTGFAAHIAHLRAIVEYVEIQVIDEFENGPRYADRHVVRLTKRDGSVVRQEVYVFATRVADGRFASLDEVTLMLDGDEADRAIGSARG